MPALKKTGQPEPKRHAMKAAPTPHAGHFTKATSYRAAQSAAAVAPGPVFSPCFPRSPALPYLHQSSSVYRTLTTSMDRCATVAGAGSAIKHTFPLALCHQRKRTSPSDGMNQPAKMDFHPAVRWPLCGQTRQDSKTDQSLSDGLELITVAWRDGPEG